MENAQETQIQKSTGVSPQYTATLDPRQKRFIDYYLDTNSDTFANCYQSAVKAGFSDQTARNLTHNKPKWYSEIVGNQQGAEAEHLLLKLTEIMNDSKEVTQNKLKAIDMLMKSKGMYQATTQNILQLNKINIQSVLD